MRSKLSRAAATLAGTVVVISISGCWIPMAIQYAPVALQAMGGIGSTAVSWAESTKSRGPGVIEMRAASEGTSEYRELRLADSEDGARWVPVVDKDTRADGWRPAANFLQMNFSPPLTAAVPTSGSRYVAYAPADSETPDARAQLLTFSEMFGAPVGTFVSDDHLYNYSLPPTLPAIEFD
jgi:hypothetical protein